MISPNIHKDVNIRRASQKDVNLEKGRDFSQNVTKVVYYHLGLEFVSIQVSRYITSMENESVAHHLFLHQLNSPCNSPAARWPVENRSPGSQFEVAAEQTDLRRFDAKVQLDFEEVTALLPGATYVEDPQRDGT